ncbi:MAG: YvcK family protein [Bacilli bacterium]|nr:YvcK family protein [Bacilli bacterium]
MKKVTVFGGGTGMSTLLKGLKEFPIDLSAVVSVCDDGRSTGKLRKEFNIPAMGDIRKVIISLAKTEPLMESLLEYRFDTCSDLNEHTVGNLLLTAGAKVTGNLSDGIKAISKVLNLRGKVIPFSEEDITLVGEMEDGSQVVGESEITESPLKIKKVFYKEEPNVCSEVLDTIKESDLIVFSMGSLYTSIIPNLLSKDVIDEIDKSNAKLMYVCNMMSQPGETDDFKVSDHINTINEYLGKRKIDVVIANNGPIDKEIIEKYATLEQKDPIYIDEDNINCEILKGNYVDLSDGFIRHNYIKLSVAIFSYLLDL